MSSSTMAETSAIRSRARTTGEIEVRVVLRADSSFAVFASLEPGCLPASHLHSIRMMTATPAQPTPEQKKARRSLVRVELANGADFDSPLQVGKAVAEAIKNGAPSIDPVRAVLAQRARGLQVDLRKPPFGGPPRCAGTSSSSARPWTAQHHGECACHQLDVPKSSVIPVTSKTSTSRIPA